MHCTLDFLFSHIICVTRYGSMARLCCDFCFTSRNIMSVFYVHRLIHSGLFSSHKSYFCCLLFFWHVTFSYLIIFTRHLIRNVFLRTTPNRYSFCFGKCFVAKILGEDTSKVTTPEVSCLASFLFFKWVFGSHCGKGGGSLVVVGGNITLLQKNKGRLLIYLRL